MPGEVILLGGGPGDPDLITVAGQNALARADVIVYDRLAPTSLLDECTGLKIAVGKIPRGPFTPQERINALLVEHANQGRTVVRFKGGDPFVFGRGGEEWEYCQAQGVKVSMIPGVTSAVAVPGLAGIPVTHRSLVQGFVTVSGHVPPGHPDSSVNWAAVAKANLTIVILMGVKYLREIVAELVDAGLDPNTPAALVENGGLESERRIDASVADLAILAEESGVRPPAITVIGDVSRALGGTA